MPRLTAAHVAESAAHIRRSWPGTPRIGLILGTGLSQAADRVSVERALPYDRIPHFSSATALSHQSRLVCGQLSGVPVLVMAGRSHLYEGYGLDQVTFPVRVLHALGARVLIVTNASGGLHPRLRGGDILVIADHINFMFAAGRLAGVSRGAWDNGGPDPPRRGALEVPPAAWERSGRGCGSCYDPALIAAALAVARREGFAAHCGVYVAVTGPNYETRAEYRMFRRIGGDAVGMSTVPEALTASSLGMRVLGLSIIANVARPDAPEKVDPQEVVAAAANAEPHLRQIVEGIAAHVRAAQPPARRS